MPFRLLVLLTMTVAMIVPPAARGQVPYTYFRVATTGGTSGFSGMFAPQINQVGSVAFGANLTNGGSGIFVGTSGVVVPIVQNGPTFTGFSGPTDINNAGQVAFIASLTAGGFGAFRGDGTTIDTIATSANGFTTFGDSPSINTAGGVAFAANLPGGGQGIFTGA